MSQDWQQRIELARGGDSAALMELLMRGYERALGRIAQQVPSDLRSRIDAADVLQVAHASASRSMTSFHGESVDAFERWVAKIAIHQLRSLVRRERAVKRGGDWTRLQDPGFERSAVGWLDILEAPARTPSRVAIQAELAEALQMALQALPPLQRDALRMLYFEGRSMAEVAATLQRSEHAVRALCQRARAALRALLEEQRSAVRAIL